MILMNLRILVLLIVVISTSVTEARGKKCLQIYYDRGPENYQLGQVYSTFLRNLAAHFPHIKQIIRPIELYEQGQIENCHSSIYLASYFENKIPHSFLRDFIKTKKHVAWMGYSIWLFSEDQQRELFGARYSHLTQLDGKNLDQKGHPGFFRHFTYKGEVFHKFGQFVERENTRQFAAAFEMSFMEILDSPSILSWSQHSSSKQKAPYIIRKANRFFVADIPFSYAHESDRYLIVADLLFDILDEQPRHKKPKALIRIEDVHPLTSVRELDAVKKVFDDEEIPLHIALVPVFYDPLYRFDRRPEQEFVPMTRAPLFMNWIERAKKSNTRFIWHGVTHQYRKIANPHTGYSSDDFEFWDAINNQPIEEDSVDFVLNRLHLGQNYLSEAKVESDVWLTPHYQASALDYRIFSQVFEWNIGRVIYFLDEHNGLPEWPVEKLNQLRFNSRSARTQNLQTEYFKNLAVQTTGDWFGQLFPYEIYGDKYGQRLIPEILGNPQPFKSDHVVWPRTVDEILADAKRNLVIRDSWASLFFHPYLLDSHLNDGIGKFDGDASELKRLIRGLKTLGYEFIDIKEFVESNRAIKNAVVEEI